MGLPFFNKHTYLLYKSKAIFLDGIVRGIIFTFFFDCMIRSLRFLIQLSLVCVYLIVLAGAVVRMTGSGMGCPDWPKCFGHLFPPSSVEQLEWKPDQWFFKGQMILMDDQLLVAKKGFTSQETINANNWKPYAKHDYAVYNPTHTWIEYINRMVTTLAGIPAFLMFLFSFFFWRSNRQFVWLSLLIISTFGFQAWLGKVLVDSVLQPFMITIHMVVAFAIIGLFLFLLHKTRVSNEKINPAYASDLFSKMILFALILVLIQVILGTQVRQQVDNAIDHYGYLDRHLWLTDLDWWFYVHRSFSILIAGVFLYLFIQNKKHQTPSIEINLSCFLILLEVVTGVLMNYFDFPFATQALHLLAASILFGLMFFAFLKSNWRYILHPV